MDSSACIINELTQGMELAKQLKSVLSSEASAERKQALIQAIISSLERTLLIVKWVDNGLEGNSDDGYSWRKYGQKDILGAKFPRSYYRCTYRYVHNCMARKQVQRTDEDPTVFEITYRAQHTCNPTAAPSVAPPQSPEKHDMKQINHHHNHQLPPQPRSGEMLSNLRENLRVSTSDLDTMVPSSFSFHSASFGSMENHQQFDFSNENLNNFLQGYAPSGSNYFTEWGNDFQHHEDTNLTEMIATNSPLAFPTDPQNLSQNFPFNSGFFL